MSIQSEIARIDSNIANSLLKVAAKGVTVPDNASSNDLPGLIEQIAGGDLGIFEKLDSGEITTSSTSNVTIEHNLGVEPDFSVVIMKTAITSSTTGPRLIAQLVIKKTVYDSGTRYSGTYMTRYMNSSESLNTLSGTISETQMAAQFTDTAFLLRNSTTVSSSSTAKTYVWFCGTFKEDYAI